MRSQRRKRVLRRFALSSRLFHPSTHVKWLAAHQTGNRSSALFFRVPLRQKEQTWWLRRMAHAKTCLCHLALRAARRQIKWKTHLQIMNVGVLLAPVGRARHALNASTANPRPPRMMIVNDNSRDEVAVCMCECVRGYACVRMCVCVCVWMCAACSCRPHARWARGCRGKAGWTDAPGNPTKHNLVHFISANQAQLCVGRGAWCRADTCRAWQQH